MEEATIGVHLQNIYKINYQKYKTNMQETINKNTEEIKGLQRQVLSLQKISIKESFDPLAFLYLKRAVMEVFSSSIPSVTIANSAPSGTAVTGSTWYVETGSMATREIWVYTGSLWAQYK